MKKIKLTQGQITIVDDDDFESLSKFKWLALRAVSGYFYATRYIRVGHKTKSISMARLILNPPPGLCVDHRNGDTLDNRKENIRVATYQQNNQNSAIKKNNKSGFKGVFYSEKNKKYIAQICVNGKRIHLGTFNNPQDASAVYEEKAREIFGEFYKPPKKI